MKRAEKLKIINETARLYKELDAACDAFAKLTSATYENGTLLDKVLRCVEFHRDHTAELIGDTQGWLGWYIHYNMCGENGYEAVIDGKKTKPIRTAVDLLRVIEASK